MTLSPCLDTIVFIQQQQLEGQAESISKKWNFPNCGKDDENCQESCTVTVHSTWKAEIHSTSYASPETMESRPTVLEYAVLESNLDGEREVRWKAASSAEKVAV
jgi:hypothetical protein